MLRNGQIFCPFSEYISTDFQKILIQPFKKFLTVIFLSPQDASEWHQLLWNFLITLGGRNEFFFYYPKSYVTWRTKNQRDFCIDSVKFVLKKILQQIKTLESNFNEKLTVVEANEIIKVISGTAADADIVFLGDRILFGNDALSSLLVKFDAATKIFFRAKTEGLTFVESQISVNVNFERSSKTFVLFLDENGKTVATTFRCLKKKNQFDIYECLYLFRFDRRQRNLPLRQVFSR